MTRRLTVVLCDICEILLTSSRAILVQTVRCSSLIRETERVCVEAVEAYAVIWHRVERINVEGLQKKDHDQSD